MGKLVKENKSTRKYTADNLIPAFIMAADLRKKLLDLDFTDNGGAIHSAERILNILGQIIKYPKLSHLNKYKNLPDAEFSVKALKAFNKGEKVLIEHVSPIRAFTQKAIEIVERPGSKAEIHRKLVIYIRKNYRLVLLTPSETLELNKMNRSTMSRTRLEDAGIEIVVKPS